MGDWIKLITAVLGLITAVVVYNKTKTKKTEEKKIVDKEIADMGDNFKTLKTTFNVVGTIALIMIIFFGFLLAWPAYGRLSMIIQNYDNKKNVDETKIEKKTETIFNENLSNNQLAFETIKLINYASPKEKQLLLLIEKSLKAEENELVISIIKEFSYNNEKTKAIDIAFDYYLKTKKYNLAASVIQYYSYNESIEKKVPILLEEIYKYRVEHLEINQDENEGIIETDL